MTDDVWEPLEALRRCADGSDDDRGRQGDDSCRQSPPGENEKAVAVDVSVTVWIARS